MTELTVDVAERGPSLGLAGSSRSIAVDRFLRESAIVWLTLALFVVLSITTDGFFATANLRNVLDQQAIIVIVATFATITMISGGIDLSLSATYVLSAVVTVRAENATGSLWLALLAGLATGLIVGAVTGGIVTVGKINSLITTLASAFVLFGLAYIVADRSILRPDDLAFRRLASTRWLGLTTATWIAVVVVLCAWLLLSRTSFGRYVYAVGGNPEAARLAGINVELVRATTFALGGLSAGLAGVITASRTLSAQASDDFTLVFAALTAIVVGGTPITGGEGGVGRTLVGAFFLAFMINGFNLNGVDPIYQRIIQGLVMLAAVLIASRSSGRQS